MAVRADDNEAVKATTAKGQIKVVATDPEYTLSVVGLVTSLAGQPVVGLVISAIALKQSKKADRYNLFALLGLIFGIIFTALTVLFVLFYTVVIFASALHGELGRY